MISTSDTDIPLHELITRLLTPAPQPPQGIKRFLPTAGTLQSLNQRLATLPVIDLINISLRGIGQVIFVNNPLSGLLILVALFLQSPWVGLMSIVGVLASTLTAMACRLDRDTIRNGIFGYNGMLVGAALATFSDPRLGAGPWGWTLTVIGFAALTTLLMNTFGVWWAKTLKSPPLTLPFCLATLMCLGLVRWLPQSWLVLANATSAATAQNLDWQLFGQSIPTGFGQVFLADQPLAGGLIVMAVALCTPLGAVVALLGVCVGILAGILMGTPPTVLSAGLWGYNALLCAMAIGGVFYAPNLRSITIGAIAAFCSALAGELWGIGFHRLQLPELTVAFCLVTTACFVILQRSLPSLVPVALHAITSPEEHRQRYQAAKVVITNFRQQLTRALQQQRHFYLFDQASPATKGDLRYLFNRIDTDQSGTLSLAELAAHLQQAGQVPSEADLERLFGCMDCDRNGSIDFAEFGELMLRHQRLMANYTEFVTYFLPIDTDGDQAISLDEMNIAMASVGEAPLSTPEADYLQQQMGDQPLTWNRFVQMLLVI